MTNAGLYIPKPLPTNFIAPCLHAANIAIVRSWIRIQTWKPHWKFKCSVEKKKSKSEAIKDVGLYEHVKITCTKGIVYKQAISILANAFEWKRLRDTE